MLHRFVRDTRPELSESETVREVRRLYWGEREGPRPPNEQRERERIAPTRGTRIETPRVLITFDTHRLGWPAPRRFYSTWRERSGDRTRVMPTVARELMPDPRRAPARAERARGRGRGSGTTARRSSRSTGSSSNGRSGGEGCSWTRTVSTKSSPSPGAAPHGARDPQFAQRKLLSAPCASVKFRSTPTRRSSPKRSATGYDLLTTANMRSIDHWEVNEWVRRHHNGFGLRNRRSCSTRTMQSWSTTKAKRGSGS